MGKPRADKNSPSELRQRGRLLTEFHAVTAHLTPPVRPHWRRAEVCLQDPRLEQQLTTLPDVTEAKFYLGYLHRARKLAAPLPLLSRLSQLIHGDFTGWKLLFEEGQLAGLLDFELSRPDHRVADFCLAWRGQYDELIHAYHEVLPLEEVEWEMLTPLWWAFLLDSFVTGLKRGLPDDGWTARMLRRRSALLTSSPALP